MLIHADDINLESGEKASAGPPLCVRRGEKAGNLASPRRAWRQSLHPQGELTVKNTQKHFRSAEVRNCFAVWFLFIDLVLAISNGLRISGCGSVSERSLTSFEMTDRLLCCHSERMRGIFPHGAIQKNSNCTTTTASHAENSSNNRRILLVSRSWTIDDLTEIDFLGIRNVTVG